MVKWWVLWLFAGCPRNAANMQNGCQSPKRKTSFNLLVMCKHWYFKQLCWKPITIHEIICWSMIFSECGIFSHFLVATEGATKGATILLLENRTVTITDRQISDHYSSHRNSSTRPCKTWLVTSRRGNRSQVRHCFCHLINVLWASQKRAGS